MKSSFSIKEVFGREVLDSRGNPTVEVDITLSDGSTGRAIVPSGASKGAHEALELRDGDPQRYLGLGTLSAVRNVNEVIGKAIKGMGFPDVQALDSRLLELDGTQQKSKLGANAILGVSLAFIHAVADSQKRPLYVLINEMMGLSSKDLLLPVPLMNVLNGGVHANNGLEIQEFMIVPHGFTVFSDALRAGCEIFHHLKKNLSSKGYSTAVGDEGGVAPNLKSGDEAFELILQAIESAGYKPHSQVSLALDVASSSFFSSQENKYRLRHSGSDLQDSAGMIDYYKELLSRFPIVSIEDGLDENDWAGWQDMTIKYGANVQLVGDDLFVTDPNRVKRGIKENIANAVLIKLNQVGTLKETFETMLLCRKNQYRAITSHRSGETEDVTIAHLAVGSGCGQIKTGSASRSERIAKYNELLRIEEIAMREGNPIPFARLF